MGDAGSIEEAVARTATELRAAVRRKSAQELALSGAARALSQRTPLLDEALVDVVSSCARREQLTRPLFLAAVRALGERSQPASVACLQPLLARDDRGGLVTCSAASLCEHRGLAEPLARATLCSRPNLAFGVELARVVRGEADGRALTALASRLKEEHRIEVTTELLLPLSWSARETLRLAEACAVLRASERHLGRWLVLAEPLVRLGDERPLRELSASMEQSASSARSAWGLLAWALGARERPVRPTAEHIVRLSDRPSGERDSTFLFRLAQGREPSVKPLLEAQLRGEDPSSPAAVRAALYLARDHGRADAERWLLRVLRQRASGARLGLALAALAELGREEEVREALPRLLEGRAVGPRAWAILVAHREGAEPLVTEARYRWLELGWLS